MSDNFKSPKTWAELVSIKSSLVNHPGVYRRKPLILLFYILYLYLIPQKLRHNIILRQIGDHPYKLAPNNFPYNKLLKNLPNVKQFCLWSSIGPLPAQKVDNIIRTAYPRSHFFWFENFPKNRSVPEIWHCHVFVNDQ